MMAYDQKIVLTNYLAMPDKLPANPNGWSRKMVLHMNFGGGKNGGKSATFAVFMPDKGATPIGYQYDTRKGGLTGFTLPGVKPVMTWPELCSIWPIWIERARKKQKSAAK
jgi:hypothetical protein